MCLTSFRTVRLLKTQPLTMSISEESNQLIQQQISRRHTTRQLSDIMQTRSEVGDEGQLWKEISQEVYKDADKLFKMIGEAYTVLSDPAQGTNGRGARSTANGGRYGGRGEKLLLGQACHGRFRRSDRIRARPNPKDTLTCVARAGTLSVQRRLLGHDRLCMFMGNIQRRFTCHTRSRRKGVNYEKPIAP
ncbi:hypothetical protein HKD37_08G023324 [Glycine soja]|uniref:J domain-containing protein n=1 Tax=Glycine soja TaxID=3848 RepID=A0A445JLB4_GLYSO|nr:hypothetical protein D0Y65_021968 [Glycine soja]